MGRALTTSDCTLDSFRKHGLLKPAVKKEIERLDSQAKLSQLKFTKTSFEKWHVEIDSELNTCFRAALEDLFTHKKYKQAQRKRLFTLVELTQAPSHEINSRCFSLT